MDKSMGTPFFNGKVECCQAAADRQTKAVTLDLDSTSRMHHLP